MSFSSFAFESLPATPLNKAGFPIPSPLSTHGFPLHSAIDTFCFKTPLGRSPGPYPSTPGPSRKRGSTRQKENEPLSDVLPSLDQAQPPSKKRRTVRDKLDSIFLAIKKEKLTFGEFIYLASRHKDENNQPLQRSQTHATSISSFLQGKTTHTPSMIVDCWYQSADGRASATGSIPLFATSPVYTEIKPVRAGLTAFAAQIVEKELVREAREVVKSTSGLHATSKKRGSQRMEWVDISASTVSRVTEIYKDVQSFTWHLMNRIAGKDDFEEVSGVIRAVKRRRPTEMVCTHALSSLNFTRNNEARLLPLARGLLYFSFSAPADLIAYESRIGNMPAYTTIYNALKGLATHEAAVISAHASDPQKWGFLQFDNVQNYTRQRDHRIGRVNKMNIGIAATYCEFQDVDLKAADLDDKVRRVAENKRAKITVEQLLAMIDQKHLDTVFELHWLRVLTSSIPELSKWQDHISMLFREKASKQQLPVKATKVHPLASSGKNETITTELKDGLFDFLGQMGQNDKLYNRRLTIAGGDGLTFQKMMELQRYLQFHTDDFQSLKILEPTLSQWHTEWTDLSRVYETHWGSLLSPDPSTLGHSAAKINRPAPSSLKKVDYYPATDLMYLILEVRMLDCWRNHFQCTDIFEYFKTKASTNSLPDIEDLISAARKLHRTFSTTRGIYYALADTRTQSDWADNVPMGSVWPLPPDIISSQPSAKPPTKKSKANPISTMHPQGDRVLASSITFMRDGLMSREMSYAVAEGDIGRVYEILKVFLFTFSGSSHGKYSTYLLEFICRLELESSKELREAVLKATLVNLSGRAGAFTSADVMQEFFNRLLEAIVEKKGVEYGDTFIRDVVSRNLHHFARIKSDLREGVQLGKRSGRHSVPHVNPEIRTLLQVYKDCELHFRRPGRVYEDSDRDDFQKGFLKLGGGGKLRNWIFHTTTSRNMTADEEAQVPADRQDLNDSDSEGGDDGFDSLPPPLGYREIVEGRLVFASMDDLVTDIDDILTEMEGESQIELE